MLYANIKTNGRGPEATSRVRFVHSFVMRSALAGMLSGGSALVLVTVFGVAQCIGVPWHPSRYALITGSASHPCVVRSWLPLCSACPQTSKLNKVLAAQGMGIVEFETRDEAQHAIATLDESEVCSPVTCLLS